LTSFIDNILLDQVNRCGLQIMHLRAALSAMRLPSHMTAIGVIWWWYWNWV